LRIGIETDGLQDGLDEAGRARVTNGGVGVYIYNLIKNLQKLGGGHQYFLLRHGQGRLDIFEDAESYLGRSGKFDPIARGLDLLPRRAAKKLSLDLVHFPNQFGGMLLSPRTKRVVTLHDMTPILYPQFHPARSVIGYKLLMKRSLRRADHVIVDSQATEKELVQARLVDSYKLTQVPLGVSTAFRPGIRTAAFERRFALPDRYLLSVGVLEPRKNHGLLYEVIDRLRRDRQEISLVIAGREGWKWKDPLMDSRFAHLRSSVRIIRDVPDADMAELYGRAAAFAYPSFHEGFGLPALEAMACGVPIVVSDCSSLPEVAGEAGLLADPHDPAAFASQILRTLREPALREVMISAGLSRARRFSWDGTARQTLAVYDRVLGLQ
jgi:glycosyltransferase involved in cell wall biosynthesis